MKADESLLALIKELHRIDQDIDFIGETRDEVNSDLVKLDQILERLDDERYKITKKIAEYGN